jgi:hypothetical protein
MGASHTIKLGQVGGVDIARGVEANDAPADAFVLVTDENDRLYCPGVEDEPCASLVNSMRKGWEKGSLLRCVNRGKKGGAPILIVADGRSRLKSVRIVNAEREELGLAPIRPEFVLMTEDEAYETMHTSANKQERKPLFEARCWAQYKRIFALEKLGKTALDDIETRVARKAYSELRKCTSAQTKAWDAMLSAHPEVLRMFDDKAPGLNRAAMLDIVNSTAFDGQPEAARKVIALAKAKQMPVTEAVHVAEPFTGGSDSAVAVSDSVASAPEPEKVSRGKRSERTDRREALGIKTAKTIPAKQLADLLGELRKAEETEPLDLVDPSVLLAFVLGEAEFNGLPIVDHPSMGEIVRLAKRAGIKVSK